MVYIIQTNTSLDSENKPRDFQSMMFKYSSWEEYKYNLINEESFINGYIIGTLMGNIKPRECKVENVIIDDDFHLECIINNGFVRMNVKAYRVTTEQFSNLL